ncbi:DMT family transporter [Desulfogranum japonicum]|uniref:DMT family transporter n=1 Tax=Desulfogranum japonicum TaxID=231447 RepID=UPI00054E35E1|nr:DMT family transporter [Desulfogranum japonicum]
MNIPTYFSLILTTFFWGGTFIAGRALAGSVPPATAAFYRFAIASVALLALCRIIDGRLSFPPPSLWFSLLLLGFTGVFSYNICFFNGLHYIEAGRASLIISLNPLAITLFASLFFHETLTLRQLSGVICSLVGAIFVISNGHPAVILTGSFGRGELAILGCVISWATYSLVGRSVVKTLTPLSAVLYSSILGCLMLLFPALQEGHLLLAKYSFMDVVNIAYLGLCGTAIGFSLYYQAIRKIGATRSSVFINLVPVFAILLSWVMLGEAIKPSVLSGGLLVLAGVSLTNMPKKNKKKILFKRNAT